MREEKRYPLEQARKIADGIVELLRPDCVRIEIAGSIRRKRPDVKDIEIVCIPKPYETGLFADGIAATINQWQKVKGELKYGVCRYTQRILPDGIKVDLFFAEETNWGLIFAIRTGSAEYSHTVLANGWVKKGYKAVDGYLTQGSQRFNVLEEKDLFERIGIKYIEPELRK